MPYGLQIETTNAELRDLFEGHQRARRRVDELLARKKEEAVKEYDTTFVRVARQFEDLCRLAGLDDLADRVRPSLTRREETAVPPTGGEVPGAPELASDDSGPPEEAAASETAPEEPAPEPEAESDVDLHSSRSTARPAPASSAGPAC